MTQLASAAAPAPYYALALQIACQAVNKFTNRTGVEESMAATIRRIGTAIAGAVGFHGDIKLVVLPEYFLTGPPAGEPIADWRARAAIALDGPQIAALSDIAESRKIYLAGNAYEADPNFPDLYFQTSFLIAPSGDLVLKYRRLISMYTPSPHDVLDQYLDLYGAEALFPVAETPLGRIGAVASEEILYPEIARSLVLRGAELIVHSSSEAALKGLSPKNLAKRARAMENIAGLVSANSAGILDGAMLADSTDGSSQIVDHMGRVLIEAEGGESMNVVAEIDIAAIRRARRRVGMSNFIARLPTDLFATAYGETTSPQPANGLVDAAPERAHFKQRQLDVIERLDKLGII